MSLSYSLNLGGYNKTFLLSNIYSEFTGNIKIVVDSDDKLYLQSINANSDIKKPSFKKFPINIENSWNSTLYNYIKQSDLFDRESIWKSNDTINDYKSGPRTNTILNNPPKLEGFNSKFSYFAPLHIQPTSDLPDMFVIFKLPNFKFSNQYIDYHSMSFLDQINYGECVYSIPIKNGNIGKFLKDLPISKSLIEKDYTSSVGGTWIYGIDPFKGQYSKQYIISEDVLNNTLNLTKAKKLFYNKLIAGNIFNFEFLFDDINDDSSIYYGTYLNLKDLYNINIDVNKHNEFLKFKIALDNYQDVLDDSFKLTNENGIKIYINDTNNLLNNFLYNEIFIDSIDGPTGPQNPTGPTGIYFTNYIQPTGPISPTGYSNPTGPTGPIELVVIKDKLDNLHPIVSIYEEPNSYGFIKELTLSSKNINFANFIGTKIKEGYDVDGKVLNTEGLSNLRVTIQRIRKSSTIFENGDYFSIYPNNQSNLEWRVIANNDVSCGSTLPSRYDGKLIKMNSEYFSVERHNQTRLLNINCEKIVDLYEGDIIKVSTKSFTNKPYIIEKIIYDNNRGEHILTIVDIDGNLFKNWKEWNLITIEYREKSYDYTYFDPKGSINTVSKNITNAFKAFHDIFLNVDYSDNDIIFASKYKNGIFANYTLEYNFSNSNTPSNHILINGVEAKGTNVLDYFNKLIFNRKRGKNILYGYSNELNNKSRFYLPISKKLNLNGKEVIQTKNGKIEFDKNYIDGQIIYHSNYIDDYRIVNNSINYTNVKDYIVYQLKDKNDDVLIGNNGMISIGYKYKPEILKLDILDVEIF